MRVTIHQPEHFPWLGLLDKVTKADLFVVLDTVQFRKNYFQNRNRIRSPDGWSWITVPVRRPTHVPIANIEADLDARSRNHYLNLVASLYRRAHFFDDYFPTVVELIGADDPSLLRLNMRILDFLFDHLEIETPRVLASQLELPPVSGGTNVTLAISRCVGASTYLSGMSGRDYLDVEPFATHGIDVRFHDFAHPVYAQLHAPFVPCMSVLDLLFNEGPRSPAIVRGRGVPTMEPFAPS